MAEQVFARPVYVLDRDLTLPLSAKIWDTAERLTILHGESRASEKTKPFSEKGARCFALPEMSGKLSLEAMIHAVGADGVHDLWVEAGGSLFGALAREGRLQRAYLLLCPKWLGPEAKSAFAESPFVGVKAVGYSTLGQDALAEWTF